MYYCKKELNEQLKIPINFDSLCTICGSDINNENDLQLLECNHKFHYKCILKYLISNLNQNSKHNQNCCPYCKQSFNFLPLKNNIKYIKYIHEIPKPKLNSNEISYYCKGFSLSGEMCKKKVAINGSYCHIHKLFVNYS
jgi:hypothetical protein